jgi:hypothetical protein
MKVNLFNQDFEKAPKQFASIKGSERIQINNVLSAISIAVVAILVGSNPNTRTSNPALLNIIAELTASIPLLVTSSLLYSKICYRPASEYKYWNGGAWTTHTLGYFLIIDSLFLLLYSNNYHFAGYLLLILTLALVLVYSVLDVITAGERTLMNERLLEKIIKFICYLAIIYFGSLYLI